MRYRPEIDGLRAIAVIPVILFHAGFETFSGGLIGVDVFFVISGYLITSIMLSKMDEGKTGRAKALPVKLLESCYFGTTLEACGPF